MKTKMIKEYVKSFKTACILILIFSLVLSSNAPAFAQEFQGTDGERITHEINADGTVINEWTVEENDEGIDVLRTEDYPNGDACAFFLKRGEILYSSYLDRTNHLIIDTDHTTGIATSKKNEHVKTEITEQNENNLLNDNEDTYNYVIVGSIFYHLTRTKEGVLVESKPELIVERSAFSGTMRENINGRYERKLGLISTLADLFSLSSEVATSLAGRIMDKLGLAATALEIIIPTYYVETAYNTVTWHGTGQIVTKAIQGTHTTFYFPDGSMQSEKDSSYYSVSSIANGNIELGIKLGKLYYPTFTTHKVVKMVPK